MGGDLHECEKVTERTERPLGVGCGFANHLGIQPDSGELDEVGIIGSRQINGNDFALLDDLPSGFEIPEWNTNLGGKDIHRANRKNSKAHGRSADSVNDFVERAVSTSGYDHFHPVVHGLLGDLASVARLGGEVHGHTARECMDTLAELAGFIATGGRV